MVTRPIQRQIPFFLGVTPQDVFEKYVELGGRDFDTARAYGDHEDRLGTWLRASGVVESARVLTKGGVPGLDGRGRLTELRTDIEASLEHLGASRVDGFLVHKDEPTTPVEVVAEALAGIVRDNLANFVGVSNWSDSRVSALIGALKDIDGPPLTYVSNYFGLARASSPAWGPGDATATVEMVRRALAGDFELLAWSPLSHGYFARPEGDGSATLGGEENLRRKAILESVARDHGAKVIDVLVRWLVSGAPQVVPVIATKSASHLLATANASRDAGLDSAVADLDGRLGAAALDAGSFSESA